MVNLWLIYRLTRSIMVNVCFFLWFQGFQVNRRTLVIWWPFCIFLKPRLCESISRTSIGTLDTGKTPFSSISTRKLMNHKGFCCLRWMQSATTPGRNVGKKIRWGVMYAAIYGRKITSWNMLAEPVPHTSASADMELKPQTASGDGLSHFLKIRMQHRPQHGAWKWGLKMGHLGEILIRIQDPRIFHYDDMNWNPPVLPNIVNLRSGKHEINLFPFLQAFLLKLDMLQIPSWAQLIWINHGWVFVVPENYEGFPHSIHWLYHHVPICSYTFPSFSISFYLFPIENWHVGKPPLRPRLAKQEDLNSLDAWPNTWGWGWWVGEIDCFLGKRLKELPATWIMFVPYLEMSWG